MQRSVCAVDRKDLDRVLHPFALGELRNRIVRVAHDAEPAIARMRPAGGDLEVTALIEDVSLAAADPIAAAQTDRPAIRLVVELADEPGVVVPQVHPPAVGGQREAEPWAVLQPDMLDDAVPVPAPASGPTLHRAGPRPAVDDLDLSDAVPQPEPRRLVEPVAALGPTTAAGPGV